MAIAEVGSGSQRNNAQGVAVSSRTCAYPGNVTAGSLLVVWAWKAVLGTTPDRFIAGDLTKSSGTATISTPTLDKVYGYDGDNCIDVAVWSCIVTGGGSLTMVVGGNASMYINVTVDEFSGSWDAGRVEDSNQNTDYGVYHNAGNVTSAGGALFVGGLITSSNTTYAQTPDASFVTVSEWLTNTTTPSGGATFKIVGTGTTTNAGWTDTGATFNGAAVVVAYKEAAAGGVDATLAATESTDTAVLASSATQIAHPTSDISTNSWQASGGGALYAMIDEVTADDADYIYSPDNPTTQECEVKFGALADPGVHTGHTLHYHLQAMGMDTNFTLTLVQGTTQIDQWIEIVSAADGVVVRSHMMAVAVAANISDYTNLRLRILAAAP